MKIDTSKPKSWDKFVSGMGLSGIEKLLLKSCIPEIWQPPTIVLSLDPAQSPFFSKEREDCLGLAIRDYLGIKDIDFRILVRMNRPSDMLESIKSRVKLEEKENKKYVACCPFHKEKTPSFMWDNDKQFYHCFGCGVHGDGEHFIKEYDNQKIIEDMVEGRRKRELTPETEPLLLKEICRLIVENKKRMDSILATARKVDADYERLLFLTGIKKEEDEFPI